MVSFGSCQAVKPTSSRGARSMLPGTEAAGVYTRTSGGPSAFGALPGPCTLQLSAAGIGVSGASQEAGGLGLGVLLLAGRLCLALGKPAFGVYVGKTTPGETEGQQVLRGQEPWAPQTHLFPGERDLQPGSTSSPRLAPTSASNPGLYSRIAGQRSLVLVSHAGGKGGNCLGGFLGP